jgi:Ca2+:H+ antiporter
MYKRLPLPAVQRQSYAGHGGDTSFASNHPRSVPGLAGNTPTSTPDHRASASHGSTGASHPQQSTGNTQQGLPAPMQLPAGMTAEEVNRAFQVVAATASVFQSQNGSASHQLRNVTSNGLHPQQGSGGQMSTPQHTLKRLASHIHEREFSQNAGQLEAADEGGHGGHDAPNWSRSKSCSVLIGCTLLYAIISGETACLLGYTCKC